MPLLERVVVAVFALLLVPVYLIASQGAEPVLDPAAAQFGLAGVVLLAFGVWAEPRIRPGTADAVGVVVFCGLCLFLAAVIAGSYGMKPA